MDIKKEKTKEMSEMSAVDKNKGDKIMRTFLGRPLVDLFVASLVALVALGIVLACEPAHAQEGFASYYTIASCQREGTSGVYTASGEPYLESALTCALPGKPDDSVWAVYGHRTGHTVYVRHNDKGPGKGPRSKGVIIDLTPEAFKQVCGSLDQGKCEVSIQGVI